MRILATCLLLICCIIDGFSQPVFDITKQITKSSKKLARKEFIRMWKEYEEVSGLLAYGEASQYKFIPIPSFVISKEGANYDFTQRIIDYLIPNERNPIEAALLVQKDNDPFRKNKFRGSIDCFSAVFHNDNTPCNLDISSGEEDNTINYTWKKGYEALSKRKYSFLFSVRHIRNCWWFIEKGQVYLLDLDELKIYNPDEYIKLKCSDQVIRDIALDKEWHLICN